MDADAPGVRGKRKPRGRPFAPGHSIGKETRFGPRNVANPSGFPRTMAEARKRALTAACKLIAQLDEMVDRGETPTAEELQAIKTLGDIGGLPSCQDLAKAEVDYLRALADPNIPAEQKARMVESWRARWEAQEPPKALPDPEK